MSTMGTLKGNFTPKSGRGYVRLELLSNIPSGDSPGQKNMESDTESPEVDISVL